MKYFLAPIAFFLLATTLFAQDKAVTPIEFVETISIVGSEEVPIFGGYPTIYEDEILIFDTDAFTIYAFDREGNLKHHFGSEGQGPSEFLNPISVWRGAEQNYYVHDFGNGRIQRFSPDWKYMDKQSISYNLVYIPLPKSSGFDYALLTKGRRCSVSDFCNVKLVNHETGHTKFFGNDAGDYRMANWFGVIDPTETYIFYVRIEGNSINKSKLDGSETASFPLLSSEHHDDASTDVWKMFLYKGHLLVQHARRNNVHKSDFFISVYDLDGNLVIDAINIDEQIAAIINDQFYFVDKIDGDEYTSFEIKIADPFFDL